VATESREILVTINIEKKKKATLHNAPAVTLQYSANQLSRKTDKLQSENPRFSTGSAIMYVCHH
jgi:hypothetical protein